MNYKIVHKQEDKRFETEVDGYRAYVMYRIEDGKLDILHTIVPKPIEGRGIAASLVKYAYDYAIENGLKPQATCTYAEMWLVRHPEYNK